MADVTVSDAVSHVASNRMVYNPSFSPVPNPQYWADQAAWDAYKASLALTVREERKRCREIMQAYADAAPFGVRAHIFDLMRRIDSPQSQAGD